MDGPFLLSDCFQKSYKYFESRPLSAALRSLLMLGRDMATYTCGLLAVLENAVTPQTRGAMLVPREGKAEGVQTGTSEERDHARVFPLFPFIPWG